jgi:hypothetical protein
MSGRNFGSLIMVASCASAALGCYLVSLRVASERAQLEDVESRIVLAQRDMRMVQTEIGTRARLSQLERWNAKVLALSAPAADQFVSGGFELAKLAQPQHKVDFQAPVVLASAPALQRSPLAEPTGDVEPASPHLLHEASLKTNIALETREVPEKPVAALPLKAAGSPHGDKSTAQPVTAAKPAQKKAVDKPGLAAAKRPKAVDKPTLAKGKAMTKPAVVAKVDPLAPLPGKHPIKVALKTSKDMHPGR